MSLNQIDARLVLKEVFLTYEELQELEQEFEVEHCGSSGQYVGYQWYLAVSKDGNTIVNVYVK